MNAPFFCERILLALPLHNELIGSLVIPSLVAQCRDAPRSHGVITLHAAFTAAVRMIDRIHHHTTDCWTDSHMTRAAGLTDGDVLMIKVANLPDGCEAINIHQSH